MKQSGFLQKGVKMVEYIFFGKQQIRKIIEKKDVIIVYLKNDECWVCDKNFTPITDEQGLVKFKLATK